MFIAKGPKFIYEKSVKKLNLMSNFANCLKDINKRELDITSVAKK